MVQDKGITDDITLGLRLISKFTGNLSVFFFYMISAPVVFYTINLSVMLQFMVLARRWPALMVHWERVEQQLPPYQSQMERQRLACRLRTVTYVVLTAALGEYLICCSGGSNNFIDFCV